MQEYIAEKFDRIMKMEVHKTQKQVALIEECLLDRAFWTFIYYGFNSELTPFYKNKRELNFVHPDEDIDPDISTMNLYMLYKQMPIFFKETNAGISDEKIKDVAFYIKCLNKSESDFFKTMITHSHGFKHEWINEIFEEIKKIKEMRKW